MYAKMHEILKARGVEEIPSVSSVSEWREIRAEYVRILCEEEYGLPVPEPESLVFEVTDPPAPTCAGKAELRRVRAVATLRGKVFSFPFCVVIPRGRAGEIPFYVHVNFRPDVPDRYMPTEEIIDHGFAILSFYYQDITSDSGRWDKLAAILYPDGQRPANGAGKIQCWAWAARRVLDYASTLPELDMSRAGMTGHSRLGKTTLVAGMLDERFTRVAPNDSGCGGDAISRGKKGERIQDITRTFPFWFCPKFKEYSDETKLFFDQHFLLATIAPRRLLLGSAERDEWADPESQFLSAVAASKAWENLGGRGLVAEDRLPRPGDVWDEGGIRFHERFGTHYFSREDWGRYLRNS